MRTGHGVDPTPTGERVPDADRHRRARWVHDLVEDAIRECGGELLLHDARLDADRIGERLVDNGADVDPTDRICCRIDVLVRHLTHRDGDRPAPGFRSDVRSTDCRARTRVAVSEHDPVEEN